MTKLAPWLLTAGLLGTGPAAADPPPRSDWVVAPYDWETTLPEGLPIHLENLWGDLRIRGAKSDLAQVRGFTQRHRDDTRPIDIRPIVTEERLRFEVIFPATEGDAGAPESWSGRRADFTIYVPLASPLSVETRDGVLEALYVGDELTAVSTSGDIAVYGTKAVRATSDSGSVHGQLPDPAWAGTLDLSTRSGAVEVSFRRDANLDIDARTRGTFTTHYSVEIVPEELDVRRARIRIGEGAGAVKIESDHGAVTFTEIGVLEEKLAEPAEP